MSTYRPKSGNITVRTVYTSVILDTAHLKKQKGQKSITLTLCNVKLVVIEFIIA